MVRCFPHTLEFSQSNNTTDKSDVSEHHEELTFSGYSEVGTKNQSPLYKIEMMSAW